MSTVLFPTDQFVFMRSGQLSLPLPILRDLTSKQAPNLSSQTPIQLPFLQSPAMHSLSSAFGIILPPYRTGDSLLLHTIKG